MCAVEIYKNETDIGERKEKGRMNVRGLSQIICVR